jgi:hypothetical protein
VVLELVFLEDLDAVAAPAWQALEQRRNLRIGERIHATFAGRTFLAGQVLCDIGHDLLYLKW